LQGTTTIIINDEDDQSGLVLAESQTRAKRSISGSTKDLYVALQANEISPLTATFTATGSLTKSVINKDDELLLRKLQLVGDDVQYKLIYQRKTLF